MRVRPLTLGQANDFIRNHHRHHRPVVGHRYSLGVYGVDGLIHGCVVVGRPVSRMVDPYLVAEVTRLCTDGLKNACSFLYSAAARVAKEMGFEKIQTYILDSESGVSLKAAGWAWEANTAGGDWNRGWRKGRRTDQPMVKKQRWSKSLVMSPHIPMLVTMTEALESAPVVRKPVSCAESTSGGGK